MVEKDNNTKVNRVKLDFSTSIVEVESNTVSFKRVVETANFFAKVMGKSSKERMKKVGVG